MVVPVRKSLLEIIPAEGIEADCTVVAATERAAVPRALIPQLLALLLSFGLALLSPATALAALPPGNAVTDPAAILRDALPVDQPELRDLQHRLEATSDDLRARRWSSIKTSCERTQRQFNLKRSAIAEAVSSDRQATAEQLLSQLDTNLEELCASSALQERDGFLEQRRLTLADIGSLEELFVGDFPYAIPAEFDALPRLLGLSLIHI